MIDALKKFNWVMFAAMLGLIAVGTLSIHSAGWARAEAVFHTMWISNLLTACFGLVLYCILAFTDYRKYLGLISWPLYVGALILLVAVLIFGSSVYGGKRWLFFFQPSEIAKLCLLAFLAAKLGDDSSYLSSIKGSFRGLLLIGALITLPCLLILAEPDLGTTLAFVPAATLILFVARVWRKGLVILFGVGFLSALIILGAVYAAEKPGVPVARREKILKCLPLKEHQVKRVRVFLFPEEDSMGAGYNLRQAKISIGSGGLTGKGFGKGETNHLKYLPQAISMNDFIFCVYAEETGYLGSLVLLTLFGLLLLPGCWVAAHASDEQGRLLALGVVMLLFAHVYINIAMSIGLVPITGLPLPFVSSGRTFLVSVMCGLGLVQSVSIHR